MNTSVMGFWGFLGSLVDYLITDTSPDSYYPKRKKPKEPEKPPQEPEISRSAYWPRAESDLKDLVNIIRYSDLDRGDIYASNGYQSIWVEKVTANEIYVSKSDVDIENTFYLPLEWAFMVSRYGVRHVRYKGALYYINT